jgi:hypothetical protein
MKWSSSSGAGLTRIYGDAILGGTRPERFRRMRDACIGFTVVFVVCSLSVSVSAVASLVRHSPIILLSTTRDYLVRLFASPSLSLLAEREPGQAMSDRSDPQYTTTPRALH